jgi:hypothetical protein
LSDCRGDGGKGVYSKAYIDYFGSIIGFCLFDGRRSSSKGLDLLSELYSIASYLKKAFIFFQRLLLNAADRGLLQSFENFNVAAFLL